MKVMIVFPPLLEAKGVPQLTQNRQFQWFSHPTFIYPLIPASAATLLKINGFEVEFVDGIAQRWLYKEFIDYVQRSEPELIAIETKTPVIKQHWQIIEHLKEMLNETRIALMGDHVTALPEESMENSRVDYVVTGGDFDVSLLGLARHLEDGGPMPKGVWYRENGKIKNSGPFELVKDLDKLPFVDRVLTKFQLYYENWYKRKPFTYLYSGRDCPWNRCTFCSWRVMNPVFRTRSVENVLDEIGFLIEKYRVKEVFNDVGTHPGGDWLRRFCNGMIERGFNGEVLYSANFRFDYIDRENARLMRKAGFRLLKVGLESASQETLDRIKKGFTIQQILDGCKIAKEAGLEIHLTIMVGYPWETRADALSTLALAKRLMEDGLADVLQSTIVIPYPGTELFRQAVEFNWFRIDPQDYEKYDMVEPVLKTEGMTPEEIMKFCDEIYKIYLSPKYVLRRLMKSLVSKDDFILNVRGIKAAVGHVKDFATRT